MDNWIVTNPEHLGGSPRVRGTRISVALILESFAAGMTIAQIVDAYPSLTEESVRGVLGELARRKNLQPAGRFYWTRIYPGSSLQRCVQKVTTWNRFTPCGSRD
jgi:uncharacterized protein (DUF433 family)